MKKTKNIFLLFIACILWFTSVLANENISNINWEENVAQEVMSWVQNLKIEWIDFLDDKTLSVKLSNTLSSLWTESEIKLLEDLKVSNSVKDLDNAKKINISLEHDLVKWFSYSLVSVWEWMDVSIDFAFDTDESKILNSVYNKDELSIEYINIVDLKNIEVFLNQDINVSIFEFKLFKELKVDSYFLDTNNINVKVWGWLNSQTSHIAILSLKDEWNKDIEVENALYDFTTPEFIASPLIETPVEVEGPLVEDNINNTSTLTWTESELTKVDEVAMNVSKTPDTWTKTNIIILFTLLITFIVFFKRKKAVI